MRAKFKGIVIEGKKRGKNLGFPTANILIEEKIDQGIYISMVTVVGQDYPAITFIGRAVTFNEKIFQAESYILDFKLDLYGKEIEVEILKKIRGNTKFDSVEKLIEKMKEDEKIARKYFDTLSSRTRFAGASARRA